MKKITLIAFSTTLAIVLFAIVGFKNIDKSAGKYATIVDRERVNDAWSCEIVTVYENGTSESSQLTKLKTGDIESGSKTITANLNKLNSEGYTLISSCKGMNSSTIMTTYIFEKR